MLWLSQAAARRAGLATLLFLVTGCGDPEPARQAGGGAAVDDGGAGGAADGGQGGAADAGDPTEITELTIEARGLRFEARAAGPANGDLVLLLHGFPETSWEWRSQLRALAAAGYRAVAPDQRGYSPGARPEGIPRYAVTELVLDVLAMADALDAPRFHLVGHDWGAAVAWAVAGVAADRVASVTPLSVPHPDAFAAVLSDPSSCQYSASAYFDFFTQPSSTDALLANDAAALRGVYAGIPEEDQAVYLEALGDRPALDAALHWYRANVADRKLTAPPLGPTQVPTLYLWSDGDTALCRDGAELTREHVAGPYRFEVIADVDHWLPEKAPDAVNALLLDHLAAHPLP